MILNTGSRTDIPAYYSDWFYERVRAGEVLVRNPYYPTQITRYRLDPAVVDALVFCTKIRCLCWSAFHCWMRLPCSGL